MALNAARLELTDDQRLNQAFWDAQAGPYDDEHGLSLAQNPLAWGAFGTPDQAVEALGPLATATVVELGCGAGYRLAAIAEAHTGSRCFGVDISRRQLEIAQARTKDGLAVQWLHTPATRIDLPSASVDLIISDFGGLTYDDPARVMPECSRLLKPGGQLCFNTTSPLAHLCLSVDASAIGPTLERDYDTLGRQQDGDGVTWVLSHGHWVELSARVGLQVTQLHELPLQLPMQRGPRASSKSPRDARKPWFRRFPAENLWCLTKP